VSAKFFTVDFRHMPQFTLLTFKYSDQTDYLRPILKYITGEISSNDTLVNHYSISSNRDGRVLEDSCLRC
jgi:hypothetical protein